MDHVRSSMLGGLFNQLQSMFKHTGTLPQIIDPFSCIVRLATLGYLDKGTKIAIYQHRVTLHPPSMLQGPLRWISGFERGDCHQLLKPIERSIILYSSSEDMNVMFDLAIAGLEHLAETYRGSSSIVVHIIELYSEIIKFRNDKQDRDVSKSFDNVEPTIPTNETVEPQSEEKQHKAVLSSKDQYCSADIMKLFKDLWSLDEIHIMRLLFEQARTNPMYLDAINEITTQKESLLYKKVMHYTDCI